MGALVTIFARNETALSQKEYLVAQAVMDKYGMLLIRQTDASPAWRVPVVLGAYCKAVGAKDNHLEEEDGIVLDEADILPKGIIRDTNKPAEPGLTKALEFDR